MLKRQIESDEKELTAADQELRTYVPIENLDQIYFKYAYVDINKIVEEINM